MLSVEQQVDRLLADVVPHLPEGDQSLIRSDLFDVDPDMALDDCMQFTLLAGIQLPAELLDSIEGTVQHAYDPELVERTLGWIDQHRERNRAAA
ncbi:hypothetical protein [Raineyella sp. W15-4]|uniref:hypothetical protein n=1 Tax=Raineyella sp. W15-4 TaxID=3081651 RepID=UPI0029533626|nr:hypothetical protein [Raineyella sp. W15-4]WOQ18198.1 hypothetical protein R0145_05750 [Raineyella sp. W15-4]